MLEHIDDSNFHEFMAYPNVFLMIGKEECVPCKNWTEELINNLLDSPETNGLASDVRLSGLPIRWGKVTLGKGKLTEFKREHGMWLSQVRDLPHNTLWVDGFLTKEWTGGGHDRLVTRLQNVGLLPIT
jgi:hypothetical protein